MTDAEQQQIVDRLIEAAKGTMNDAYVPLHEAISIITNAERCKVQHPTHPEETCIRGADHPGPHDSGLLVWVKD